jgi:hypothetical protein
MTATTLPTPRLPGAPLPNLPGAVHPPPFRLPGEHFIAALLWLGVGAAGLVVVASQLAAGNIFDPRVFAVTHCITLGVITTGIFGALYQLFPVAMGRAVRSVRTAHVTFWLLQAGIALIVAGFWFSRAPLQGLGWTAVALAAGLFGVNLISRSLRTQPDPIVGRYVMAGYVAFLATLGLGSLRIGEVLGYWHVDRLAMIASHFHLAALGFATCIAVGVGSRMLPMFLVSHGFPRWPLRWAGPLGGAGLSAFVLGQFSRLPLLILAGGLVMGLATGLYLVLAAGYFRRRLRRALDPGLAHVAVAHVALGVAVVTGALMLLAPTGFAPSRWAAYALLVLLGWLVPLIVGVQYKILPFLTWLHLFGQKMGEGPLPVVADLTRPSWGWASLACLVTGVLVIVPAVAVGSAAAVTAGAAAFALGVALVLAQAGRVLSLRYGR